MLLWATDARWTVLQSVAWASMVIRYSEHMPLSQALADTFDGQHPCCLCKAIAAARRSERKSRFPLQRARLEFPPLPERLRPEAPSQFDFLPEAANTFAEARPLVPPKPPPRTRAV